MPSHDCPKCQGLMEEGFILDATQGMQKVARWIEGTPENSLLFGLKTGGRAVIDISSWRCRRCGFLESYATT